MPLPEERNADHLTGQETIGGTVMQPDGTRLRIRTKLITLIEFSKKLRDQTNDIANAVAAYFQAHPSLFKGDKGDSGSQGIAGPTGPLGPAGVQGFKGDTGTSGAVGTQGPAGAAGATGPQGPKGDAGSQGATGATGSAGAKGDTGAAGAIGATGTQGIPGLTLLGTITVTETALILLGSGQRQVANITLAGAAVGDTLLGIPTTLPAAGYAIDNVIVTAAGKVTVTVQAPSLAIGASYSIPVKVYRMAN